MKGLAFTLRKNVISKGLRKVALLALYMAVMRNPLLGRYRRYLLSTWHTPRRRGRLDNFVYGAVFSAWLRYEYYPEPDPEVREGKKELCMGGRSGVAWAQTYNSRQLDFSARVGNMPILEANPVYSTLESVLGANINHPDCVVQIGSSSGREVAWLAENFPEVLCIGTDVFPEVIEYARRFHSAKNLEFRVLATKDIGALLEGLDRKNVVVFSSGSLQYVQPEHVETFFGTLSQVPGTQMILVEPASMVPRDPRDLEESMPRGNFSYTHNYQAIAERNSCVTLECKIIRPYGASDPVHASTAHYFWNGST